MKSVVYNSYGVWRFYLSSGQLKMYSPIISDEIDLTETDFGFSLCCDNRDNIYIICQNNYGDIYFITVNGEKTEKRCMLEAKVKDAYEKEFSLVFVNGLLNAFYMLKHEGKYIIIHHILNSENQPEIIESTDIFSPVFVSKANDDLYVFYKKNEEVVCKIFKWNEKKWKEPETICTESDNVLFINAYVTEKVNVVYCCEKKNRYSVVYATKGYKSELIKNSASLIKPVICGNESTMHVLFEYGGRILESTNNERDEVLSKPKYSYYGTFERSEAAEINTPKLNKIYTYGFETSKGVFRPLVIGDVKINKITKPAEVKNEEEVQPFKKENTVNPYEEILKMLDRGNEMKILSEIAKKLSKLESAITELVNKREGIDEDGNKDQME